jgi:hypothetical protein
MTGDVVVEFPIGSALILLDLFVSRESCGSGGWHLIRRVGLDSDLVRQFDLSRVKRDVWLNDLA